MWQEVLFPQHGPEDVILFREIQLVVNLSKCLKNVQY